MRIITIEKLFGDHDIKIDLDQKLNIMIGENGVGKSTALKIIHLIYQFDFISLSRYNFNKITLATENKLLVINRADLFPGLESLLAEIEDTIDDYDENSFRAFNYLSSDLKVTLKKKPSLYYEYLASCFFELTLSNKMKSNMSSSCFIRDIFFFDPMSKVKHAMREKTKYTRSQSSNNKDYDVRSYFIDSTIDTSIKSNKDLVNGIELFFKGTVIFLNMVDKYELKETPIENPELFSNMIIWLDQYDEVFRYGKLNLENNSKGDRYDMDMKIYPSRSLIGLPGLTPEKYADEYLGILKKAYEDIEYNSLNLVRDVNRISETLVRDQVIDINRIVSRFCYQDKYMEKINNKAISYYIDIIGEEYDLNKDYINAHDEFNDQERNQIRSYIKPLLIENSIFSTTINQILETSFEANLELKSIIERFRLFYDENIDYIINSIDPKIKEFERLLNQFITSKTFTVTPSGLKIYLKKYKEYDSGKFKIIEDESNELRMIDLSSGEKKLLIILLFSCLFDNLLFLMDEPELSFSINWQERIIETIVNLDNNNSFLIATHSPFIVSNEEIAKSIVPLPQED